MLLGDEPILKEQRLGVKPSEKVALMRFGIQTLVCGFACP